MPVTRPPDSADSSPLGAQVFYNTFASVAKNGMVAQMEFITVQMNIAKALFDPEVRTSRVRVCQESCESASLR